MLFGRSTELTQRATTKNCYISRQKELSLLNEHHREMQQNLQSALLRKPKKLSRKDSMQLLTFSSNKMRSFKYSKRLLKLQVRQNQLSWDFSVQNLQQINEVWQNIYQT